MKRYYIMLPILLSLLALSMACGGPQVIISDKILSAELNGKCSVGIPAEVTVNKLEADSYVKLYLPITNSNSGDKIVKCAPTTLNIIPDLYQPAPLGWIGIDSTFVTVAAGRTVRVPVYLKVENNTGDKHFVFGVAVREEAQETANMELWSKWYLNFK